MGIERLEIFVARCNYYDGDGTPKGNGTFETCNAEGPAGYSMGEALRLVLQLDVPWQRDADDGENVVLYCPVHRGELVKLNTSTEMPRPIGERS